MAYWWVMLKNMKSPQSPLMLERVRRTWRKMQKPVGEFPGLL